MENIMNKVNGSVERMKIGLICGLFVVLMGCLGVSGRGYYYGDSVVVSDPDMYLFGGDYYGGHYAHGYSHRGFESRGAAHFSGARGGRR